ncbi:bidirectional sugar transporter SWEET9-like [Chenopodium quinoa]|uniref:bidirectional sugar transporter SWEET9-like n=1 Tax=Chenopodium quinoa TaxID=63459 RepID=UPI000B76EF81|nr:bidirectional sugar transporter SWEET9-like [Chenopodium quinoa]
MAFSAAQLHELSVLFGILGNIVSFGVYLAPLPTFWRIFKKKSTLGFQSIPYSVALFSAMLLLYYAFIKEKNGFMIITINTIGCAIEGSYLIIYLIYAPKKAKVYTFKLLGLFNVGFFGLIVLTTMVFAHGLDEHNMLSKGGMRESVVGWICGIFSVCVFAAPLSVMRMVIKTKSVEFMPFWLSFSLTLCAIMWFFYGLLIKDFYIALPNILGFAFGIVQMILYIIYKDSKKKLNNNNGDLMIKETDIMQLQELAVDIKLGKVEKIEQNEQQNRPAEAIEVIVEEMVEVNNNNNNNNEVDNNIVKEINGKATNGNAPRGEGAC